MYSAFQWNAFQRNAFQIVTPATDSDEPIGHGYVHPYAKYKEDEYQRKLLTELNAKRKRVEDELAEAERRRLEKLAAQREKLKAKNAAKELAALEAQLQDEINRLRMERAWLMRLIDDEEAVLVLLLSSPLN